jgi:hemolysin III
LKVVFFFADICSVQADIFLTAYAIVSVMQTTKRPQTLGEEIANAISHGLGAIFGLVALTLLLIESETWQEYLSGTIFALAIFLLFISSTLYHSFPHTMRVKRLFKRFDHISIYLLIGASFAPLLLVVADQPLGLIFFITQWIIIILGIIFKAIFIDKFQVLHVTMFLLLGWSALLIMGQFSKLSTPALWLIIGGGLAYTFGVVFYANSRRFKFAHFIWHLFVITGTVLHFIANFTYIFLA